MAQFNKHWSGPKILADLRVPFSKDIADKVLAEIDAGEHDNVLNMIDPNEAVLHVNLKVVITAEHNR